MLKPDILLISNIALQILCQWYLETSCYRAPCPPLGRCQEEPTLDPWETGTSWWTGPWWRAGAPSPTCPSCPSPAVWSTSTVCLPCTTSTRRKMILMPTVLLLSKLLSIFCKLMKILSIYRLDNYGTALAEGFFDSSSDRCQNWIESGILRY